MEVVYVKNMQTQSIAAFLESITKDSKYKIYQV